jgi:hypothetical protein
MLHHARAYLAGQAKHEMLRLGLRGDVDRLLAASPDDTVRGAARELRRNLNA